MTTSDQTLAFVQQSQVVVGQWSYLPDSQRLRAAWCCLLNAPTRNDQRDVVVFTAVVTRMAQGILAADAFYDVDLSGGHRRHARDWADVVLGLLRKGHTDSRVSLGGCAQSLGLSRWHLSRIVAGESGYDFRTHLNGLRVCHAVCLLDATALSIKEVTFKVGYEHAAELDRHFRHWLKMPPREFRRWSRCGFASSIRSAPID